MLRYPYFGNGANLGATTTQAEAMGKLHSERAFGAHSRPAAAAHAAATESVQRGLDAEVGVGARKGAPRDITPPAALNSKSEVVATKAHHQPPSRISSSSMQK